MNHKLTKRKNSYPMLNLGCGKRMHSAWYNIDFSPFAYLKRKKVLGSLIIKFISYERQESFKAIDPSIIYWDIRKGIPFIDNSFNAIYSAHFLEHLYPDEASALLEECFRVIKAQGIIRLVVPDLYRLTKRYILTYAKSSKDDRGRHDHDKSTVALFEQMVRQVPAGVMKQKKGFLRYLEKKIRKNASATGETHKWMYDKYTLRYKLEEAGFNNIKVKSASSSDILDWRSYNLDMSRNGKEWAPESLYMEATKQ